MDAATVRGSELTYYTGLRLSQVSREGDGAASLTSTIQISPTLQERHMIIDILAGAVLVGVGGWAWKKLVHRWAETGKRF